MSKPRLLFAPAREHTVKVFAPEVMQQLEAHFEVERNEQVELDELFARADTVSLHAPSILETRHMVGAAQLRLLRDGALLVNTARGSLIDQEALVREAAGGRIRVALARWERLA